MKQLLQVTCQIYGHVVGACGECNTHAEAQEPYDQQALELCDTCGWKAIVPGEPCLMCERNAKMLEPEQEPVAWTLASELGFLDKSDRCSAQMFSFTEPDQEFIPLHTRPQPVAELTDDEIHEVWLQFDTVWDDIKFARAVLAAQKGKE